MIPAGAQKINKSRIPLKILYRQGATQFIKAILFIVFELKGVQPLFGMHTDSHDPDLMAECNGAKVIVHRLLWGEFIEELKIHAYDEPYFK